MSFDNLINFYKDFEIFPDIISLTQIKFVFSYLSEMFVQENSNNNKTKSNFNINLVTSYYDINESKSFVNDFKNSSAQQQKECLNYSLFLESLFISAMTFKFNEKFSSIDKVFYLY